MSQTHSPNLTWPDNDGPPDGVPQKAALFCPQCDHRSPADGDWRVLVRPDTFEVRCPECRSIVTSHAHDLAAKERSDRSR